MSDYYPFGMAMPGRTYNSNSSRYGYNGQEKTPEMHGDENWYDYKFRGCDSKLGRFFSVDPLAAKYAYNSPYAFAENRVVDGKELEGLEVLLVGKVTSAGWFIGGSVETGVVISKQGVFGYQTVSGSLSTSPGANVGLAATFYPLMPTASSAYGWGGSGTVTGSGPTGSVTGGVSYSSGYLGVTVGVGVGTPGVSGSASGGYTRLISINEIAPGDLNNMLLSSKLYLLKENISLYTENKILRDENKTLNTEISKLESLKAKTKNV